MPKYSPARIQEFHGNLSRLTCEQTRVAEFERQIGFAPWTVCAWMRRFGDTRSASSGSRAAARVELVKVEHAAPNGLIEILVGHTSIRVLPGCDPDDLRTAWEVVRGC